MEVSIEIVILVIVIISGKKEPESCSFVKMTSALFLKHTCLLIYLPIQFSCCTML